MLPFFLSYSKYLKSILYSKIFKNKKRPPYIFQKVRSLERFYNFITYYINFYIIWILKTLKNIDYIREVTSQSNFHHSGTLSETLSDKGILCALFFDSFWLQKRWNQAWLKPVELTLTWNSTGFYDFYQTNFHLD